MIAERYQEVTLFEPAPKSAGRFLTCRQAAERLGVSRARVSQLITASRVRAYRIQRRIYVSEASVGEYAVERSERRSGCNDSATVSPGSDHQSASIVQGVVSVEGG